MPDKKTVLVVVAHADDMEFMAGGTIARFIEEKGYAVYEYILTDNSKGSYHLSPDELVARSAQEAQEAARILGLRDLRFENYPDGYLNETHPNILREKIIALIRELRADIIMSWDPFAPGDEHPDHRMVAMATLEAASFSGNPLFHPDHAHPPYPVTEAYWFAKKPWQAERFVDISAVMEKKLAALLAHETQMQLTLDGLRQEAAIFQPDLELPERDDPQAYRPLIEMGIRNFCRQAGATAGLEYAEQFRYEKFGYLDLVLGEATTEPDF